MESRSLLQRDTGMHLSNLFHTVAASVVVTGVDSVHWFEWVTLFGGCLR
jgi:hypothetical protein